jgi:general secretion pathway protein D
VQVLGRYVDRPIILGQVAGGRTTLETPRPVPKSEVLKLLRGLLDANNADLVDDSTSGTYRVRQRDMVGPTGLRPPGGAGVPAPAGVQELFVIQLRHARASEVAATVSALYGRAAAVGEIGERPQTLGRELQDALVPPAGPPPAGVVPGAVGRAASLSGDVAIVPDTRANMLLVRASRGDFGLIQAAVDQLDVRPLQVLINVTIAEVRRDRALEFGVEAGMPPTRVPRRRSVVEATSAGQATGDFVVGVIGIGGADVHATLRAAASRGDATIVSRPVVIAVNNERAEITVGSQRPFVQVARVLPTDNTARDQVIQYKDVGTRLSVIPTISADGYVMLEVAQEVNAATSEQQFNAPVISTRSITTRLLVRDGQTVALGGLTDRQHETGQRGVPVLSRIPVIGGLFGSVARRTTQTELFLFITPTVIRDDEDAEAMTAPLKTRAGLTSP